VNVYTIANNPANAITGIGTDVNPRYENNAANIVTNIAPLYELINENIPSNGRNKNKNTASISVALNGDDAAPYPEVLTFDVKRIGIPVPRSPVAITLNSPGPPWNVIFSLIEMDSVL
jgi:hypothetical protein